MATSTSTVNPGTDRKDNWQLAPLLTAAVLSAFGLYVVWRVFMNFGWEAPFESGAQYLAPMYSPYFPHVFEALGLQVPEWLQKAPSGLGPAWVLSPALFILWAPFGFRATCYYYRKAYYRAFFGSPPGCAVGPGDGGFVFKLGNKTLGSLLGSGARYWGEKNFPMVFQNVHRYFFYVAALVVAILAWDAFAAFFSRDPGNYHHTFTGIRIGLGTVIFVVNVAMLGAYTFSCHSWRHIIGGHKDCYSACGKIGQIQHEAWERQTHLNEKHMELAWVSLFTVWGADFYVYALASHWIQDPVFFQATWSQMGQFLSGLVG